MSFEIELDNFPVEETKEFDEIEDRYFSKEEYSPDIEAIEDAVSQYEFENLVVIGNGGSITSFRALYYAMIDDADKEVHLVTTQEPDYLRRISKAASNEETLVMPISKSGETTSVIEALMYFIKRDYPVFAVTSDNNGALRKIVERKDYGWIEHRDVGGRFSGLTETALVPAAFAGLDVREIRNGGEEIYEEFNGQPNAAWELSQALYSAEENSFTEILSVFYSTKLFGFYPLFVQLMHETVCKDSKGQSVYGDLGPEYQHHTNQRLFGGRENIVPVFFKTRAFEKEKIEVPENLSDVGLREKTLTDFEGKELGKTLEAEFKGVRRALYDEKRPFAVFDLEAVDYSTAGMLMAFMQYLAVYSAYLRDVDPYNQPDVEKSKDEGFKQRFDV